MRKLTAQERSSLVSDALAVALSRSYDRGYRDAQRDYCDTRLNHLSAEDFEGWIADMRELRAETERVHKERFVR